jgi:hypothetical protein
MESMEAAMDNWSEPLVITALVAGLVSGGSVNRMAERDPRPTLTVVSFSGVPSQSGDAMADELASQLVETGRYRVLTRDWLSASSTGAKPSLAVLRDAAAAAGVEYLVLGDGQTTVSKVLLIEVRVVSVATGEVIRTAAGRSQMPGRTRRPIPVVPMTRPPVGALATRGRPGTGSVVGRLAAAAVSARRAPRAAPAKSWEQTLADIAKSINVSGGSR